MSNYALTARQYGGPSVKSRYRRGYEGASLCGGFYPTQHRSRSWYFSQKAVTPRPRGAVWGSGGARRDGAVLQFGYNFYEDYACRGTKVIEAENCQGILILIANRCAVSGCNNPLQNCLEGRSKAKLWRNNLPILSVLALVFCFVIWGEYFNSWQNVVRRWRWNMVSRIVPTYKIYKIKSAFFNSSNLRYGTILIIDKSWLRL